ncbi:hypothetical protein Ancab_013184 [Ancistrocladus abbreviatus]
MLGFQGSGKGCASAQLIQPGGQACSLGTSKFSQHSKEKVSLKRRTSTIFSKEETQGPMRSVSVDVGYSGIGKSSCSDSISSAPVRGVSAEVPGAISHKEQHCDDGSSKKVLCQRASTLSWGIKENFDGYLRVGDICPVDRINTCFRFSFACPGSQPLHTLDAVNADV